MAFTETTRDAVLDGFDEGSAVLPVTYASLHTADPGSTGTSEVTGGTPAYARKALTFAASSGASKGAAAVTFDVPASTDVTHFGLWTASTGGTFRGGQALPATQSFGSQGTLDLSITITAS